MFLVRIAQKGIHNSPFKFDGFGDQETPPTGLLKSKSSGCLRFGPAQDGDGRLDFEEVAAAVDAALRPERLV